MKTIVATMLGGLLLAATASAASLGRSERVLIVGNPGIELNAQLNPGVASSSLRAVELKYFNRGGGMWVRFTVDNGGVLAGSRVTFERPVLKDLKVRQRDGSVEHRALVALSLCVGHKAVESTLSVSDRAAYTAPLVIGSDNLAKLGTVDSSRAYTVEPECAAADKSEVLPAEQSRQQLAGDAAPVVPRSRAKAGYNCDGRQHCSQMNSRAEAEFFVRNCPGTKMDGDGDGIPCENDSRW